jgi:hypothetical protein
MVGVIAAVAAADLRVKDPVAFVPSGCCGKRGCGVMSAGALDRIRA